jgi:hypothetical protein
MVSGFSPTFLASFQQRLLAVGARFHFQRIVRAQRHEGMPAASEAAEQ